MSKKDQSFLHNWVDVGGPNSGIVRESNTGREGERRIIALDPIYSPANEKFIYDYRRESNVPFVKAYGSEILEFQKPTAEQKKDKQVAESLKDPYQHIAVITERIPHRLANAPQLTYPETLYVLDRALEGYETAYQKVGPFRVNDQMIGFNNQGEAKVWVNENFALNHPSYPRRRLASTRSDAQQFLEGRYGNQLPVSVDEAEMVQDVVDTVENYCEEGRFPEPFASRIHQRNLSFAEARRLLNDEISQSKVPVPNRVDLFTNKVRGFRKVTTTTQKFVDQPAQGYRFNYLQYNEPYNPDIFASRVGEHGVHRGVPY